MKIKRKRKNQIFAYQILTSGILILLLCGCAGSRGTVQTENQIELEKEGDVESETIVFVDDLGREVHTSGSPKAAALIGSFADVWLLAGGELKAAANDSWTSLSLPLGDQVVNLGSIMEPDVEKLIASNPDLVLASVNTDADLELEELLTQAGIPVAYFQVSNFEDYLHMLDICTMLTGRRDLYEEHGLKVQQEIEQVKERIDGSRPKVLFLRASASSVKAKGSRDNVCGEMLAELDCINIADNQDSLLEDLSLEAVIMEDPDYIFVTVQGTDQEAAMDNVEQLLISNPAWNSLTAVKKGQYYVLDKRLYNLKPNARWGEAYQKLADILYPVR